MIILMTGCIWAIYWLDTMDFWMDLKTNDRTDWHEVERTDRHRFLAYFRRLLHVEVWVYDIMSVSLSPNNFRRIIM
jgi:hypothetical protein